MRYSCGGGVKYFSLSYGALMFVLVALPHVKARQEGVSRQ